MIKIAIISIILFTTSVIILVSSEVIIEGMGIILLFIATVHVSDFLIGGGDSE